MGRFIEEDDEFDGVDFEDSEQGDQGFDQDAEETTASSATDERSRMRQYTERRRRIEDLIEASRMRDQLGLYEDDLFAR